MRYYLCNSFDPPSQGNWDGDSIHHWVRDDGSRTTICGVRTVEHGVSQIGYVPMSFPSDARFPSRGSRSHCDGCDE